MRSRGQPSWARWIGNTAVILIVLIWLFPVYWIVATSLKKPGDIVNPIPSFIFFDHTLDNYRTIFGPTYTFADVVLNSFIIASCVTVLVILLAIPAAYSLARWDTKGSERTAMWILSLRMLPPVAVVIPYYVLATRFELIDTYAVLIIVYMAFGLPFAVWLMRGFFAEIPRELDQAAMLDGYSYLAVLAQDHHPAGDAEHRGDGHLHVHLFVERVPARPPAHRHQRGDGARPDLQDDPCLPGALGRAFRRRGDRTSAVALRRLRAATLHRARFDAGSGEVNRSS